MAGICPYSLQVSNDADANTDWAMPEDTMTNANDTTDLLAGIPARTTDEGIVRIHGHEAIEYAEAHGLSLRKYSDPVSGSADGLSIEDARDICREDASLIYVDTRAGS